MFDFSEFDEWIPGVSGIILFFIALMFNIRVRNAVGVILFNIVLAAMFYPFCWLVAWVSLFALLAIILVVIGFFNFTIGGKT